MKKLNGLKVAILAANGVEQVELEKPRQALEAEGAQTCIISPEKETLQGWNHTEKGDEFHVDCALDKAKAEEFDALLLPGGVMNPDRLRTFPQAVALVKQMAQHNKPIAAICHGPWLLCEANVIQGRRITSWGSIKTDLMNAGAQWVDEPVVCDKNILTSRKPDDIPQFNEAMISLFQSKSI